MFLRTREAPEDIQNGWARLEDLVSTKGRKFYGALDQPTGEYWVCVELKEGDDPDALGLETGVLPGGRYLRARLRGEPPAVYGRIGPMFNELESVTSPDPTRPEIEFYRQRDEIDLLVPIAD
jgi:hypothetical protein